MDKEELKKVLKLNDPILVDKFAAQLQPYAKFIYLAGLVLLAFLVLLSVVTLLTGAISASIITIFFVCVEFVLLRMFCEFLVSYKK